MRIWGKLAVAAAAPLLLTGCLWGPGKFTSTLALNKAGTFVLDYRGEILLQMPEKDADAAAWNNGFAKCYEDGRTEVDPSALTAEGADADAADDGSRPCTAAEVAK